MRQSRTVRRMIVDSIATEKRGLRGRATSTGHARPRPVTRLGDQMARGNSVQLHKVGVPVVYDNSPAVFRMVIR